jgi:hypothetical protein
MAELRATAQFKICASRFDRQHRTALAARCRRVILDGYGVPRAGIEPACLSAPPPQDGVSTNSTTWANIRLWPTPLASEGRQTTGRVSAADAVPASGRT